MLGSLGKESFKTLEVNIRSINAIWILSLKGLVIKYVRGGSIWGGGVNKKNWGNFRRGGGPLKIWRRRRRKWGGAIKKMAKKGGAIKNFGAEGAGRGGGKKKNRVSKNILPPLPHILSDHSLSVSLMTYFLCYCNMKARRD